MSTLYRRDMLYVPSNLVRKSDLQSHFTVDHFDDKTCRRAGDGGTVCDERSTRPTDICRTCPAFYGRYKFYRKGTINDEPYIGLAQGDESLLRSILGDPKQYDIVDLRIDKPMRSNLQFKAKKLYPFQRKAVEKMQRRSRGLLKSAPRTGKTVIFTALACALKQRTVIFTHQDDLLNQFYETIFKFTNAKELSDDTVVLVKNNADLKQSADILLTTYQRFLSKAGQKRLLSLREKYGCVLVDEIHRGNADGYSRVISHMSPKYMYGCSGTLTRKDGREFIMDRVLGSLIHETAAQALTPKVQIHISKMVRKTRGKLWNTIVKELYSNSERHKDIVKQIIKDIEAGHSIVIPLIHRGYIDAMVEDINKAWMEHTNTSECPAVAFYRYSNPARKEEILEAARNGEIKVVAALRSMLLGVNVPRWSLLYEISPINNAPGFEQETLRICTPIDGKKQPLIRFYVDLLCGASVSCFWNCWRQMGQLGFDLKHKDNGALLAQINARRRDNFNTQPILVGQPGKRMSL